jgi:hypothetical protein
MFLVHDEVLKLILLQQDYASKPMLASPTHYQLCNIVLEFCHNTYRDQGARSNKQMS